MNKTIVSCRNLHKSYFQGKLEVPVLMGIDLDILAGETTISYSEVGFLSLTDGSLQNLGQKTLRPTGSLQFSGYQPGTGADFFMLASPGGGYLAEIIATDAPMNGELWRLNWGNGVNPASSMNIAIDEGGQAWLRIGLDQVKPLTLRDYRTARGATPMP